MKKRKILSGLVCAVISISTTLGITSNTFAYEREPVEIISKRTEYSKTYDNGNGTYTQYVNTAPIHYVSNNEWVEIDNSLIVDNNGNYTTKNNAMDVELASSISINDMSCISNNENQMLEINNGEYSFSWSMVDPDNNISSKRITAENNVSMLNVESDIELGAKTISDNTSSIDSSELIENLETSATYYSIYPDTDLKIDILPNCVKDTIVINSKNAVKDKFMYYIQADGLDARVNEDNSIDFISETNEIVFFIPPAFMFDSSENSEHNYDIDVNLSEFKNGYLLTMMPDTEWLNSSDRVFPIMIDPAASMGGDPFKHSTYVYEGSPDSTYSNSYIKVGGSAASGTRNEAFIFPQQMYLGFDDSIEILDVECTIDVLCVTNNTYAPSINVDLLTDSTSTLSWNATRSVGYECCAEFNISENNPVGEYSIDLTNLFQMWLNYYKTDGVVGAPFYGFKLAQKANEGETIVAYSSRVASHAPYFTMTYRVNQPYVLDYAPAKYNNYGNINNFQNRMNCYAYALQTYYNGTLSSYSLNVGEFGIGHNLPNCDYNASNYEALRGYYGDFNNEFQDIIEDIHVRLYGYYEQNLNHMVDYTSNDSVFQDEISDFTNFVQEQMEKDSIAMNFNIDLVDTGIEFSLPSDFDESNERIIAMITYYAADSMYSGVADYHYYLRNGNGTCPNGHGGTCSMWTHKQHLDEVKNWPGESKSIMLCDENIGEQAYTLGFRFKTAFYIDDNIRYYRITKDTSIYNSWHGNSNGGATPYRP